MKLDQIERIKDISDINIPCYAVKIKGKYVIVYYNKHKRLYNKIFKIWEIKAMEYARLKNVIKNITNVKEKNIRFEELMVINNFIGN